jgi:glycosyltransferase involved in cell wall biosynthesis
MTLSTREPRSAGTPSAGQLRSAGTPPAPLDAEWRATRERVQEAALRSGPTVVSCAAPLGTGGLGRHLQETLDALGRRGERASCLCEPLDPATAGSQTGLGTRAGLWAAAPAARLSPGWRAWRTCVAFDAAAARRLPPVEHLIAFNGQALEQFRGARRAGTESLALMSATAHLRSVVRQHTRAHARHPFERSWASRLLQRNLLEYAHADRIHVSSRYAWESFLAEGVAEERLSLFPLTPSPRFSPNPAPARHPSSRFDVVYVGGLSVAKGVALLVDAFSRLTHGDMRLLLVGGAETRGMRRFLARARARDSRIEVLPGDPLPVLRAARLYVHPSYTDGFGYAATEALACGLPVLVSEDTGMKELVGSARDGLVLPTGDMGALTEAIDCAYRGELRGG